MLRCLRTLSFLMQLKISYNREYLFFYFLGGGKMARYILRRLGYMFVTLFIIATVSFFLMKMLPGSPLNAEEKLSEEQKAIVLEKYGLNDPVPVQYVRYMAGLVKGDLGISFKFDGHWT